MVAGGARGPRVSRYLYPSAVFLLLILLELVRGVRFRPRLIWLGAGALLVSLVPNLVNLNDEARQIRDFASLERSQLGALELLRDEVPAASIPALRLDRGVLIVDRAGAHRRHDVLRGSRSLREPGLQPGGDRRRGREPARGRSTRCSSRATISPSPSFPPAAQPAGTTAGGHSAPRSASVGRSAFLPPAWRSGLERSSSAVTVLARRFATRFQPLERPARAGAAAPQARDEPARQAVARA